MISTMSTLTISTKACFFVDYCNYLHWWRPVRLLDLPEGATRALQWKCVFPHLVACGARRRAHRRLGQSGHGPESYKRVQGRASRRALSLRFCPTKENSVPQKHKMLISLLHFGSTNPVWFNHFSFGSTIFNLVQPITRFGSTNPFGSTKSLWFSQSTNNRCTLVEPFWFGWTILLSISGVLVQPIRRLFNIFVQFCCFGSTNRILVQPIILVQQRFV